MEKMFKLIELESIAKALADTADGLTGSEIGSILQILKFSDPTPSETKWRRLYNAFNKRQNYSQNRRAILEFIRQSMNPLRYVKSPDRFEAIRENLNSALAFCGITVDETGTISEGEKANTIMKAYQQAEELKNVLVKRGVHADVLIFCRAELIRDNYFHAVLEATKSIAQKLRSMTNLTDDGADLVDAVLSGKNPTLAINSLATKSERSEQTGFCNLVKGTFGMFRNPTCHEARILWEINKEDAEDLLSLVSLIHRRLDKAKKRG